MTEQIRFKTTEEIELKIARYFNPRRNIIVPNVWWGLGLDHECDLIVLTKTGYAYEVEIKISRSDLKADLLKKHAHGNIKLRKLYFGIPDTLLDSINLIPENAGIITVKTSGELAGMVRKIREAKINPFARRFNSEEILKLAELGCMRIWTLKNKILNLSSGLLTK